MHGLLGKGVPLDKEIVSYAIRVEKEALASCVELVVLEAISQEDDLGITKVRRSCKGQLKKMSTAAHETDGHEQEGLKRFVHEAIWKMAEAKSSFKRA